MGTWLGHVAPGSYFLVFSLWWLIRTMQDYYTKQGSYVNTTSKTCCCKRGCFTRTHMESIAIIATAISGVVAELVTGFNPETSYIPVGNIQHLTMYTAFGIGGITELLLYHNFKFLPRNADYLVMIIALLVELVLFSFHLHGRTLMDKHIHMLLVYSIGGCIVAISVEMYFDKSIKAAISRSYFFMLQGTWFIQIGFILYNPLPGFKPWNGDDAENVMVTTLIYAWHMIGCLIVTIVVCGLTYLCCSRQHPSHSRPLRMTLIDKGQSGYTPDDEESRMLAGYNSLDEFEEDNLFTAPSSYNTSSK